MSHIYFGRLTRLVLLISIAISASGRVLADANNQPAKESSARQAIQSSRAADENAKPDRTKSVKGTDANSNGIRDDVERYIAATNYVPEQKAALLQLSKAISAAMHSSVSKTADLSAAATGMDDAMGCIWKQYPADKAVDAIREIRKMTINTRSRYEAFRRYNAAVSGAALKPKKEPRCN